MKVASWHLLYKPKPNKEFMSIFYSIKICGNGCSFRVNSRAKINALRRFRWHKCTKYEWVRNRCHKWNFNWKALPRKSSYSILPSWSKSIRFIIWFACKSDTYFPCLSSQFLISLASNVPEFSASKSSNSFTIEKCKY